MNKIAEVLREQGRSIAWLAKKIDVKVNTVYNYTGNINQPSNATLKKVAEALDVAMEDLVD